MTDQKRPPRKVERLSLEDLEKRLAPAPVWAGGAFPGKGNGKNLDNANENAAFFKFADSGDSGDDDIPTDPPTDLPTSPPTAMPTSPPDPYTSPPPPPTDLPTSPPSPYGPPPP